MRRKISINCLFAAAVLSASLLGSASLRADEPATLDLSETTSTAIGESVVAPNTATSPAPIEAAPIDGGHAVVEGSVGHLHDGACTNCFPRPGRNPDLFYNYYLPPGCGQIGSSLYLSPGPVPQHVGHTYITYQPLMPHEFMYPHHRTYYQYYDGGRGLNRTHIKYYHSPFTKVGRVLSHFKIAR